MNDSKPQHHGRIFSYSGSLKFLGEMSRANRFFSYGKKVDCMARSVILAFLLL